jgi:transcriptional regulator with XRE-family HTH domain
MSGSELKQRRLEMKLSIKDLAERLGVIEATLMMWEEQEKACLQFERMLELAMSSIEAEVFGLTDEEMNEIQRKVNEVLESSGKLL